MADRIVAITKTFIITFQDEDGFETHSDEELEEFALEGIADLVRADTEYTEFGHRDTCDVVTVLNAAMDYKKIRQYVSVLLAESLAKPPVIAIDEDMELTLNEFDLHDWVVGLNHTENMTQNLQGEHGESYFASMKLEAQGYEDEDGNHIVISEGTRSYLEAAANKLLESIQAMSALVHDKAEYSC